MIHGVEDQVAVGLLDHSKLVPIQRASEKVFMPAPSAHAA